EKRFTQNVENFIKKEFTDSGSIVIYKKIDYKSNPKTIELGFLSQSYDSLEIANYNKELIDFGISNTILSIRQYNSELKSEIMSELNKNNANLSEKDLEINSLRQETQQYQIADKELLRDLRIIFPELENLAIGKMKNFTTNDSVCNSIAILFEAKEGIDKSKLKDWLALKMNDK